MGSSQAHCACVSPGQRWGRGEREERERIGWNETRGEWWWAVVGDSIISSVILTADHNSALKRCRPRSQNFALSPRHLSVLLKYFPGNPGMKPGLGSTSLDEYSQFEWGKLDQSAGMLSLHGGISEFIYPCHAISRWGWWLSQHHIEEELHHLLYTVPGTGQLVSGLSFLRPSLSRHSLP